MHFKFSEWHLIGGSQNRTQSEGAQAFSIQVVSWLCPPGDPL
jgi:hypothetical protein